MVTNTAVPVHRLTCSDSRIIRCLWWLAWAVARCCRRHRDQLIAAWGSVTVVLVSAASRRLASGTVKAARPGGGGGWAAVIATRIARAAMATTVNRCQAVQVRHW